MDKLKAMQKAHEAKLKKQMKPPAMRPQFQRQSRFSLNPIATAGSIALTLHRTVVGDVCKGHGMEEKGEMGKGKSKK